LQAPKVTLLFETKVTKPFFSLQSINAANWSRTLPTLSVNTNVERPLPLGTITDTTWRAILCDLDGCLISGDTLLSGVQVFTRQVHDRLWIVSNNSTDTPQSLTARLAGMGLCVAPSRVLLAGAEAITDLARRRPGARVALFASQRLHDYAEDHGLQIVRECPDTVLLCRDVHFDYAALTHLVGHLQRGTELIVANPDTSHPSLLGPPVPETGALLAAVRAVVPDPPLRIIGKPQPFLFELALARAGVTAREALMIGDNASTDGAGAHGLGIAYASVVPNAGFPHLTGGSPC
jgi:HAD superfamily hydrolase (TIGR01450 family)|tara:strand:- start:2761 stop:3636 length:876 start_codon:yes stop_codon:yes gene_type:complete